MLFLIADKTRKKCHELEFTSFTEIIKLQSSRPFPDTTTRRETGIDPKIVNKECRRKYKISRSDRFRYRTRYFADAGIIGSKEFVAEVFDQVNHMLRSIDERTFTPIGGVEGVYSMKRLAGA